eukprot:TRINITY_DN4927_c0_g1_i4.p1 TRINITY_DN4927_c0_g1~~TRINITY_DN4927_c0_g1_i4.p1  ORF type:complete len:230 (-),score=43.42 TRINITY_DN4927_c0_g1_i4:261-911(-)
MATASLLAASTACFSFATPRACRISQDLKAHLSKTSNQQCGVFRWNELPVRYSYQQSGSRQCFDHCRANATRSSSSSSDSSSSAEVVYFDGGPHVGDLVVNLIFGLTAVWLPLTLASVFRSLFLRYRFTSSRVTTLSGLGEDERKDFSYAAIKDVKVVPRFIGEWGDMAITLTDDTVVELKSLPKFREIAKWCVDKAAEAVDLKSAVAARSKPKGF